MPTVTVGVQPVYGLPAQLPIPSPRLGTLWGATNVLACEPASPSIGLIVWDENSGDNGLISSIAGLDAVWQRAVSGQRPSGNTVWSDDWFGLIPAGVPAGSVTVTPPNLRNRTSALVLLSSRLRLVGVASGNGSNVTITVTGGVGGRLAVVHAYTRVGTLSLPSDWTTLQVASNDGSHIVGFKFLGMGQVPVVVVRGATDNVVVLMTIWGLKPQPA